MPAAAVERPNTVSHFPAADFSASAYVWRRVVRVVNRVCLSAPFIVTADLQLAAELGKTLLERNKALELTIKQKQTVIEDQEHQIEVRWLCSVFRGGLVLKLGILGMLCAVPAQTDGRPARGERLAVAHLREPRGEHQRSGEE